jgi:metal-responsive CopG/Arc/MetJ family transcriptional regulator
MKTAISIPDPTYRGADRLARKLRMSRSTLYSTAVSRFIREHERHDITSRLNEVYSSSPTISKLPVDVAAMQFLSIDEDKW